MQRTLSLKLTLSDAAQDPTIQKNIAGILGVPQHTITGYHVLRHSLDSRGKQTWVNLSVHVFINEPYQPRERFSPQYRTVSGRSKKVIIVGSGPAGLFAALKLIEMGIMPIILERGKDVRARRRDLALLNKTGTINPESNYCFGEGGAGTYSDGKLYTRSSKRGDINRILNLFVHFGAEENILFEAHPHIGTNKLPGIITAMREQILECGGIYLFEKKVIDFTIRDGTVHSVQTSDGATYEAGAVLLATGHSARDIFNLLAEKKIQIHAKPFALGVRVEHQQSLIDSVRYHSKTRDPLLPPASYSWVEQVNGRGVFSFCMCPGGIIAPAATSQGELVVNGWSPSKRNNPFANSGIVVSLEEKDWAHFTNKGPLAALHFQQSIEEKAFEAGGGKFVAPAQRLVDFTENKFSASLPECSYLPGITSYKLQEILPPFIFKRLQMGFKAAGKKIKGYLTNEAVVVATESRTSSPVRIPRNPQTLHHPQVTNLYPCGEGAGYAGGIMSAAMDGERVAVQVAESL